MKNTIEEIFKEKVLCIFYGGSHAYGLASEKSDKDVMVIIDDNKPLRHYIYFNDLTKERIECFIVGRSYFKKVHSFDDDTNDFVVAHADNILGLKFHNTLIYIDESYKNEFNQIVCEDWSLKLAKFLHRFVSFYKLTIQYDATNYKKHYHVYRIRAMLDNLDLTGSFDLTYVEPYKTIMTVFKDHYRFIPSKHKEINEILDYIKDYANRLEEKK